MIYVFSRRKIFNISGNRMNLKQRILLKNGSLYICIVIRSSENENGKKKFYGERQISWMDLENSVNVKRTLVNNLQNEIMKEK